MNGTRTSLLRKMSIPYQESKKNHKLDRWTSPKAKQIKVYEDKLSLTTDPKLREQLMDCIKQLEGD